MKKVFVLGSRYSNGKNDVATLSATLEKSLDSIDVQVIYFEDLLFEIESGHQRIVDLNSNTDLSNAGLTLAFNWYKSGSESIYRDIAYTIALYLKHRGKKFWNEEMVEQRSTTKLSATMLLALNGFDVPATYFSLSVDSLKKHSLKYPVILKDAAASRGRNNFLIKNEDELQQRLGLGKQKLNRLLLQEFIPNDGDFRIVCFNNQPKLIIRRQRTSNDTHLNNTSTGARAQLVELKDLRPEIIIACQKICQLFGRNMAGIDLIASNDGLSRQVFLEVNAIPQLTSGSFVEEKIDSMARNIREYLER